MFEPIVSGQQVDNAVAINIGRGSTLGVFKAAGLIAAFTRLTRVNRGEWPRLGVARIRGDIGNEERLGALIPEDKLSLAGLFEVAEYLIIMLSLAALFDDVTFPGHFWVELWIRILPPPNLIALPVATEDDVEVAIAVDIVHRAPGLNSQELRLDDVTIPIGRSSTVPNQGRGFGAETQNEILDAVLVQIRDNITGLLRRFS